MTNETIEDIVAEMRLHTRCSAADAFYDVTAWTKLCDRIEKAAKRDVEDTQGLVEDNRQLAVDLDAMKAENDRLRAALKPVLAVNIDGMDSYCRVNCEELLKSIVREAQRIYKEGEAND